MQKNHCYALITKLINIKLEWTRTRCDSAGKQSQINNRFDIILSAEFYIDVSEKPLDRPYVLQLFHYYHKPQFLD